MHRTRRLTSDSQRDEPLPTLNAAIHLLATIYTAVLDMPEFHRRVVVPTIQKFSVVLVQLAEKPQSPVKLKVCYTTLFLCKYSQILSGSMFAHVDAARPPPSQFACRRTSQAP